MNEVVPEPDDVFVNVTDPAETGVKM